MSVTHCFVAALAFSSAASCLAQPAFDYVVDGRRCIAFFSGNGSGSTFDVPRSPFEFYQGGANIEADNGFEFWQASSTQESSCSDRVMTMIGTGAASAFAALGNTLSAQGTSQFEVRFTCAADTPYHLDGTIGETGHPSSVAEVRLSTAGGEVIHQAVSTTDSSAAVFFDGTLAPGTYILFARAMGRATAFPGQTQSGQASCVLTFAGPSEAACDVDWNGDSVVDSSDFLAFIADFLAGNGDYNHDGVSSSDDFFDFLQDFLGGC